MAATAPPPEGGPATREGGADAALSTVACWCRLGDWPFVPLARRQSFQPYMCTGCSSPWSSTASKSLPRLSADRRRYAVRGQDVGGHLLGVKVPLQPIPGLRNPL
eukprot:16610-Chlamydomonas_euryale.AAC.2